MRDPADTRTSEIEAFPLPKTPGRKRVHASAADRQRAYRERKRAVQVQSVLQGQPETVTKNVTENSKAELLAQLQVIADRDREIERLRLALENERAEKEKALYYEGVNVKECERLRYKITDLEREIDLLRRPVPKPKRSRGGIPSEIADDLALLLAQYTHKSGCTSEVPNPSWGSASGGEIKMSWGRLRAAVDGLKKRNVTKKGQGDLTARLQEIAKMLDYPVPEMKKLGRAKLDGLIFDLQS
jgi:hypothetical protein